ncbi:MAG: insulinase family protein [Chlorobi bacterium]|nr:MAG: processing peptidase [Chlorobi bacterium OLB6]MBE2266167.1 insulinase family protein [Flavobacteriales bacterium]MBL1162060.1 insulinase family protein [Chlorobiota bacterium]MBW7853820.1 insulinase family protein [Candidatus Kapabacteria bacterium]MCL4277851.1 insulinase family protein [Ignavibacteria bacterium]
MKKRSVAIAIIAVLALVGMNMYAQTKSKKQKKQKTTATTPATGTTPMISNSEAIDKPDINVQPGPLPPKEFNFPPYEEFTTENGIHVYVIEDHALPRVTMSLITRAGDAYDPANKEGVASMMADMLLKGTQKHTASQLAEKLDGSGVSISARTSGEQFTISGSALKQSTELMFSTLGEILTGATFPADEFDKLKEQTIASIAAKQASPSEQAQALSRKVIYGMDNPFARYQTKATTASITADDVKTFYHSWLKPNISSIALVGDITIAEAKKLLATHLNSWKTGEVPKQNVGDISTAKPGVYFIPRKGSVQSSIVVCAAAPGVTTDDWTAVDLMSGYIGSGFGSLLFKTLRETYSYTYSPFAATTRVKRYNRIFMGADVRSSVTDSAINVIYHELANLAKTGPDEEELSRRIAYEVGMYQLSLEKVSNVASYLQSAWVYDMPVSWVAEWTTRMQEVGPDKVTQMCRKYLSPLDLRLVVVGDPSVRPMLEQFGPIFEFTQDMQPAAEQKLQDAGITADELIAAYTAALGAEGVSGLKTVTMQGAAEMNFQGQVLKGTVLRKFMMPDKEMSLLDLNVMKQQQWTNGDKAWESNPDGSVSELEPAEASRIKENATPFPPLIWKLKGYTIAVKGKTDNAIIVETVSPSGKTSRHTFDASTRLLMQSERDETTPQGPVPIIEKYSNYQNVQGVNFPMKYTMESSLYTITYAYSVSTNQGVTEADFTPAETK